METHREQGSLSLHAREASCELDFANAEGVTCMESTIHVWVGHSAEELGVLCSKLGGGHRVEGYLDGGGGVGLEDSILLPFCLIFLLYSYKSISFLGLWSHIVS